MSVKIIGVVYTKSSRAHKDESATRYAFKTYLNDLAVDDLVVVESSNGLGLAVVVEIFTDEAAAKVSAKHWVVAKVDVSEFYNLRARARKRAKLEAELRRRAEEAIRQASLKALISGNAELEALYAEYEGLAGDEELYRELGE